MTLEELLALPAAVPLVKAGEALGMGRTGSYSAARAGTFPIPVLPHGKYLMTRRSDLLDYLRVEDRAA